MSSAWTPAKVAAFKSAFFDFLECVFIDSKEKGGGYCLADGVYEAQHRLLNGIFEGLAEDIHDFKVLKSRQLGISTISEALFAFFLGITPGCQAAVIFDTDEHTQEARMRIINLIESLPKSLGYPEITGNSRKLMKLGNKSSVRWLAAGVRETESSGNLGRSSGLNVVWASEISSWKNEEGVTSLKETLSETFPDRLYIWESTARGYNSWRDMWVEAKADDLNQKAIFIGWWSHPGHVIARTDRKFERYGEKEPTKKETALIEEVRVRYSHEITMEQLAWHRWKMDPTREQEKGETKGGQFKQQEQPTVEEECFTQAGSSFFDHVALNQHTLRAISSGKSKNYKYLFGSEFPQTVITSAIYHKEVELRVWNDPQPGVRYIVGADVAFGRNPNNDRSACEVYACYADCIEQVAEYASATTNTQKFAWVVASLAAWYRNVDLIMEIDGPGEAVWKEYNDLPNLLRSPYMRQSAGERGLLDVFNNVRSYIFARPDSMSGAGNNWQWKTGNRKEAIMESTKSLADAGNIIIKSDALIEEMRTMARDGASIESPSGKKDDRVLATAFVVRCWEDSVRRGLLAKNYTREAHLNAQKMTTSARFDIFMQNTISQMFHKNARMAAAAARAAKQAQQLRRR